MREWILVSTRILEGMANNISEPIRISQMSLKME